MIHVPKILVACNARRNQRQSRWTSQLHECAHTPRHSLDTIQMIFLCGAGDWVWCLRSVIWHSLKEKSTSLWFLSKKPYGAGCLFVHRNGNLYSFFPERYIIICQQRQWCSRCFKRHNRLPLSKAGQLAEPRVFTLNKLPDSFCGAFFFLTHQVSEACCILNLTWIFLNCLEIRKVQHQN